MKQITATLEWRRMIGTPTKSMTLNKFRAAACFLIPTSLVLVTLFIRHLSSNSAFILISTTHLGSYTRTHDKVLFIADYKLVVAQVLFTPDRFVWT